VTYQLLKSPTDAVKRTANTYYNFTGVRPDTSYTVTVAGINMAGIGESNRITVRTLNENEVVINSEYIMCTQ